MDFCPECANMLQIDTCVPARFFCRTCPYIYPIERGVKIRKTVQLPNKEATPVAVGEKNVGPTTEVPCPKCHHGKAAYHQMQTRSADEPMTIFYKCLNESCGNQWRED